MVTLYMIPACPTPDSKCGITIDDRGQMAMASRFNGASRRSEGNFCTVRPPNRIARATASACLLVSISRTTPTFSAQDPATKAPATAPTVDALVDLYFRTDDEKERTKLASTIEKTADGST